jgi:hypothetical protein
MLQASRRAAKSAPSHAQSPTAAQTIDLDEEFFSATVLCLILSYHAAPYPIIVM